MSLSEFDLLPRPDVASSTLSGGALSDSLRFLDSLRKWSHAAGYCIPPMVVDIETCQTKAP